MFCKYCGSKMPENAKFCQNCGGSNEPITGGNAPVNNQPVVNNPIPPQPVNNPTMNNTPMTNNTPKKNNTILLIVLIIIGICAIAVPIILTAVNKGNDDEEIKENTNVNNEQKEEEKEPEVEYPTNTIEVQYSGYTFAIPKEYTYMEYEGNLALIPSDSSWIIMFVFSDGEFDVLKTQLDVLDDTLADQYENASSQYKTYQGYEYILTDFVSDGSKMQMILTDAGNGKILMTLTMPLDTSVTFNDLFEIAFPIAISVK